MLVIKNNVDLKELEKYGFKKHKNDEDKVILSKLASRMENLADNYEKVDKPVLRFYSLLEIWKIKNDLVVIIPPFLTCYAELSDTALDTIYELIKNDLIERKQLYE